MECEYCGHLREDCYTIKISTPKKGVSKGKWGDNVTPKRGWTCLGSTDLGEGNSQLCDMCETECPRYIHHMSHGNLRFDVGCICSAYMDGREDEEAVLQQAITTAEARQRDLENRASRREAFPNLAAWKISEKGTEYINKNEVNIIIVKSIYRNIYSAIVGGVTLDRWVETPQLAKLMAFDHINPIPHIPVNPVILEP